MSDLESNAIARSDAVRSAAVVGALAAMVGVAAAFCSASPTGSTGSDAVVMFVVATFVAWAGASAPWWLITAAGIAAAAGTAISPWTAPSLVATGIGLILAFSTDHRPTDASEWLRVVAVGCIVVAMLNLRINAFLGASAIAAGVVLVAIVVVGLVMREQHVRRRALWAMLGVGLFVLLGAAGMGIGVAQARNKLQSGNDLLQTGFDQLRAGDTKSAADTLRRAAADLRAAQDDLDSPWTQPSRLLPVVAQHRALATNILASASSSASTAAAALAAVDIDQLRLVGGRLDLSKVEVLAKPFADLNAAVHRLATVFDAGGSPWLLGVVRTEIAKAHGKIDNALVQTDAIAALTERGPAMLGADGARRYLVVFTTPGDARGQSGVIDNYAEITVTSGRITQSGFGRTSDLVKAVSAADPLHLQASDEYLARYGPFGAGGATTPVAADFWTAATMSPDAPTVSNVLSQMYAAAGHGEVDGVIIVDPSGLAALLEVAGPITVQLGNPPTAQQIDSQQLVQFLLHDQYTLDDAQRRSVIEAAAGATLREFLATTLPDPQQLGADLGPAATQGHITWWVRRPDEEQVIELIGMSGRLPAPAGSDGLAIVTNNASANSIDTFLQRGVQYTATYDAATGDVNGDLTVTLRNAAPTSGYGDYVIGNDLGLPSGTNRTLLSIYSPLATQAVSIDGQRVTATADTELEWNVSTVQLDLPPGATRTIHVTLSGRISNDGYTFIWRPQPLTLPDTLVLSAGRPSGGAIIFSGTLNRTSIIDAAGVKAAR